MNGQRSTAYVMNGLILLGRGALCYTDVLSGYEALDETLISHNVLRTLIGRYLRCAGLEDELRSSFFRVKMSFLSMWLNIRPQSWHPCTFDVRWCVFLTMMHVSDHCYYSCHNVQMEMTTSRL